MSFEKLYPLRHNSSYPFTFTVRCTYGKGSVGRNRVPLIAICRPRVLGIVKLIVTGIVCTVVNPDFQSAVGIVFYGYTHVRIGGGGYGTYLATICCYCSYVITSRAP